MTLLPIVTRELRVAARRRTTYLVRTGAALLVMCLGTWLYLMMRDNPPQDIAEAMFVLLTAAAVFHCLMSGVRSTGDCLSREKREGTLGLLFLTDLKGYDVVLGKLAANSVHSLYGVLAVLPLLAIPMLLGAIAGGEFARMALVVINTLFFSLCLGLCVSALCRSARQAMGLTFLLLLLFTAALPVTAGLLRYHWHLRQAGWLFLPSVGFTYYTAFDQVYRSSPHYAQAFWLSLAVVQGLGWLALGVAALVAPHCWQDRPAGLPLLRWRQRWRLWSYGDPADRQAFRRYLLDRNAYFWLAARARLKPAYVWAAFGLLGCVWAWGLARFRLEDWLNPGTYAMTALALNALLKVWVASEAGRQLAEERQQGAWELLLSTPLGVGEIVHGQFLALRRQFLGPLLLTLALGLVLMFASLSEVQAVEERAACVATYLWAMVILVADLVGMYWTGMWQGLNAADPNRASRGVLLRIIVLPWVAYALVALVLSLPWGTTAPDPGWKFYLGLWVGLGLAADLGFGFWSKAKLLGEFRAAAEQRFTPRPGLLRRLLGRGQ